MSGNIRDIREISNEPLTKFVNSLAKKLSKNIIGDETEKLENKEDVYSEGQDVDSVIKYHNLNSTKTFNFDIEYYPPLEPDNNYLRLWLQGTNLGNRLKDWSLTDKNASLFGDPMLVDGIPFDLGIHTGGVKSTALRLNRPTSQSENDEYIQVSDEGISSLDIAGITVGKSYFVRFKTYSLAQQGGYNRTLFEKIDGPTVEDAVVATITTDGRLTFSVIRSGVTYSKQTAAGTITTNTVYDAWFTFDQTTKVIQIYVNNVNKSLSNISIPTLQSDTSDDSLWIGQRGKGPEAGFLYGDLYDYRVYHEKVATGSHVVFDGANDYLYVDDTVSPLWNDVAFTKFSLSMWVNSTSDMFGAGGAGFRVMFRNLDDINPNRIACYFYGDDGSVPDSIWFDFNGGPGPGGTYVYRDATDLVHNEWYHMTFVWDNTLGTHKAKIYVNAVNNDADFGDVAGTYTGGLDTVLGSFFANNDGLKGHMRDFRWWSTTALTQPQIANVMNNSSSAPIPTYWLPMNEGTGDPLDFISGTRTTSLNEGAAWTMDTSEIGNHYKNKWTISDIEFGHVMISDYYAMYNSMGPGYTLAGYTTTGYTAG